MDRLALFSTFLRVVDLGSFTAVARERGTTQPTISRQIAALEEHLGCLLLQRNTRQVALTEEGRLFYGRALQALERVGEAEAAVGQRRGRPTGTLILSCPAVLGRLHVLPRLERFLSHYPDLSVDLRLSDRFVDLTEEGIDLAIRVGHVTDENLIARRIGLTRRVVLATPAYLERFGVPQEPQDLTHHDCIIYRGLSAGAQWLFAGKHGTQAIPVRGRTQVDTTEGLRAAILAGLGIGVAPIWHFVDSEIERGLLRVVLAEFEPEAHPIHALYTTRRFLAPKIRAMIDFLAEEFARDPTLSPAL